MPNDLAVRHRYAPRFAAAAAMAGLALLAGACSSSSSPGTPTPTGPPPPTSLHGHKAGGPNGYITAPASNPPSSGVPGGSEVFPGINDKLRHKLANHIVTMTGVQNVTYYPQFKELQVYYKEDATDDDRDAVYTYVSDHS